MFGRKKKRRQHEEFVEAVQALNPPAGPPRPRKRPRCVCCGGVNPTWTIGGDGVCEPCFRACRVETMTSGYEKWTHDWVSDEDFEVYRTKILEDLHGKAMGEVPERVDRPAIGGWPRGA